MTAIQAGRSHHRTLPEEAKRRLWQLTRDERVQAMRSGRIPLWLCLHWAGRAPHEVTNVRVVAKTDGWTGLAERFGSDLLGPPPVAWSQVDVSSQLCATVGELDRPGPCPASRAPGGRQGGRLGHTDQLERELSVELRLSFSSWTCRPRPGCRPGCPA